ncbi:MAG TPA: hypothetical protein VGM19_04935 [Armatimonadota bacterium]|jgi:hypothetical protein
MQTSQAAHSLQRRAQIGDAEALRALLYSVADGLYSSALAASPDEAQAADLTEAVWRAWLGELGRWRWRESLLGSLRRVLAEEIERRADEQVAAQALALWDASSEEPLFPAPPELIQRLAETLIYAVPVVRGRVQRRRRALWATLIVSVFIVIGSSINLGGVLFRLAGGQVQTVKWQGLQDYVRTQHLDWLVRDLMFNLNDPQGTDKPQHQVLAQVVTVLEEVSLGPNEPGRENRAVIRDRLESGNLAWECRNLADDAAPADRPTLMHVTLALEEAQNL